MKLSIFVKTSSGDFHLSDDELPGFDVKHSARFDAKQFNTIEKARDAAFEYIGDDHHVIYIWDLVDDCEIQRVFL